MAIKGSFKAFGIPVQSAYARLATVQGNPQEGWRATIMVFSDSAAVDTCKAAAAASKQAQTAYEQSLVDSMTASLALQADPENADKKAAHAAAVTAESAAYKAREPAQAALNLAREAMAAIPVGDAISAPYVSGHDPIVDLYAVLKANPNYVGMVDC